jgi:hypothetical protein
LESDIKKFFDTESNLLIVKMNLKYSENTKERILKIKQILDRSKNGFKVSSINKKE